MMSYQRPARDPEFMATQRDTPPKEHNHGFNTCTRKVGIGAKQS